jgi:hypothetical protein
MIDPMKGIRDESAKAAFGMTREEAQEQGICIHCKQVALGRIHTPAGHREYHITAMCEVCWDELFGDDDE